LKLIWDTVASQIEGDWSIEQLMLKSTKNVTISKLEMFGVFMTIGSKPNNSQGRGCYF
jgi:thioredoxin reductase